MLRSKSLEPLLQMSPLGLHVKWRSLPSIVAAIKTAPGPKSTISSPDQRLPQLQVPVGGDKELLVTFVGGSENILTT